MFAVPLRLVHGDPVWEQMRVLRPPRSGPVCTLPPARLVLCVGALRRPRSG